MDRAEPRRVRTTCHFVVVVLALAFVVGHAYDIATSAEHWPWSPYRMYSSAKASKHAALEVWGVRADKKRRGKPVAFRLRPRGFVIPIARFKKLYAKGSDENKQQTQAALVKFRDYYERERASGKFEGPPLAAIRLYQVTWSLQASANNIGAPDQRVLVVETPLANGPATKRSKIRPAATRPTTRPTTTTSPAVTGGRS